MNGGTNLALAVDTAGQMLRDNLPVGSPRTIIILTDGRIDYYQGKTIAQLHIASSIVTYTDQIVGKPKNITKHKEPFKP